MTQNRPGQVLQPGPNLSFDIAGGGPQVPPDLYNPAMPNDTMAPLPLPSRGIHGLGYPSPGSSGFEIPTSLPAQQIPSYAPTRGFNIDYNPEHQGIDMERQLIGAQPLERDYHPSLMRKIFAGIAAGTGGGPLAWEYITKGPFNEANRDWARQFAPAKELATQERFSNANERALYTAQLNDQARDKALAATIAQRGVTNDQSQQKIDLTRDQQAWMQAHPGFQVEHPKGGNITLIGKDGKTFDTGIPTGTMTEASSMEQKHEYTMDEIMRRVEGAIRVAGINAAKVGEGQVFNAPDPEHPGQTIGVERRGGKWVPIEIDGKKIGDLMKPGTPKAGTSTAAPETFRRMAERSLATLNELIDTKTGKLKPEVHGALGASGKTFDVPILGIEEASRRPKSYYMRNRIKTAQAQQVVELVAEYKNASKTGSGLFGQMSDADRETLSNASLAADLDPMLEDSIFEANVLKIKGALERALAAPASQSQGTTTGGTTTGGQKKSKEDWLKLVQ